MSKDVTMRDIAKKLNVSAVSVSKAISGKDGVSDETRELILNTAQDMGYEYTSPKIEKKSHYNICVLVAQAYISDSAFYSKIFQNLVMGFGKEEHSCTLEIISAKREREGKLPSCLTGSHMDGIIALGPMPDVCIDAMLHMDTPCVFLDNDTVNDTVDCIVSDNVYGSHMLTNYLIAKGHRKIAFVGNVDATNSIMDRYLGYIKGLLQNGLKTREDYVISDRDKEGFAIPLIFPKDMPDAFVCNCDEVAYRLISQLNESGYKVPEDISVVGFDDYIFATLARPQLTTFKVDMVKMSKVAVEKMLSRLENKGADRGRIVISGEIVIRDSVKRI